MWLVRALDFHPLYSVLAVAGGLTVLYAGLSWPWDVRARLRALFTRIEYGPDERPDPRYTLEPVDRERASPVFREFFHHYFVDSILLYRSEVDFGFMRRMGPEELALARRLVRANLAHGSHFIEGAALLGDREAAPEMHRLLDAERDLGARLPIGRALWMLERSTVFPELLSRMVRSRDPALKQRHCEDVLLLADERAVDLLLTLSEDGDAGVRDAALSWLSELAGARRPRDAAYFRARCSDAEFRTHLVRAMNEWRDFKPVVEDPS